MTIICSLGERHKIRQYKIEKELTRLSQDFCCNIPMVGQDFGVHNINEWDSACLVSTVHYGRGNRLNAAA